MNQVLRSKGLPIPSPLTMDYLLEYDLELNGSYRQDNKTYDYAVDQFNEFMPEHDVMKLLGRDAKLWIKHLREVREHSGETISKRVTAVAALIGNFFRDHDICHEMRNVDELECFNLRHLIIRPQTEPIYIEASERPTRSVLQGKILYIGYLGV